MKIGVLYIAIGRYTVFWKDFYQSAEKYFLPGHPKSYFLFTDSEVPFWDKSNLNIRPFYQNKLGWPFDTLMRFDIFLQAEEYLKEMDYLFFFNANMLFVQRIIDEDIFKEDKNLIGLTHPLFFGKMPDNFSYERNELSLACMNYQEGETYFMGSFNGGRQEQYIKLIHVLSQRIHQDLDRGIIALWHDESHLNRYLWENRACVETLSEKYGIPEEWVSGILSKYNKKKIKKFNPKIVIRDKGHFRYGGHHWLRGETDKKQSIYSKQNLKRIFFKIKFLLANS